MPRPVVTGSILSQFGEPTQTEYSPYATLPRELSRFVEQIAKIKFPVNSKRDLLEKLGGPAAPVWIGENVVEAAQALMFLPAQLFPLADAANFAEKLSDHFASRAPRRRQQELSREEIRALAGRFMTENPEVVIAAAEAVYHLKQIDPSKDTDTDAVAARFLKKSDRLIQSVGAAFQSIDRLRAKTREDLVSGESQPGKTPRAPGGNVEATLDEPGDDAGT